MNKRMIIGNVGAEPESRHTPNGDMVCNITVATTEKWKDKHGKNNESTTWHKVVCFRKLAEIVEKYVSKGKKIYVEGKHQEVQWEDKEGNKRYSNQIVAEKIEFLSDGGNKQQNNSQSPNYETPDDDDYPF